jgi:hypothetical protein
MLPVSLGDDELLAEEGVLRKAVCAGAAHVGDDLEGDARARSEQVTPCTSDSLERPADDAQDPPGEALQHGCG